MYIMSYLLDGFSEVNCQKQVFGTFLGTITWSLLKSLDQMDIWVSNPVKHVIMFSLENKLWINNSMEETLDGKLKDINFGLVMFVVT